MRQFLFVLVGLLLLNSTAIASDFSAQIKDAEILGKNIFEQDQAAWVATDAMLEDKKVFESLKTSLKGWISIKDGKTFNTAFIIETDAGPKVAYDVTTRKRKVRDTAYHTQPRNLTHEESRRWTIRKKLVSSNVEYCPNYLPMNTIVFPVPESTVGNYYEYLFSASKQAGIIVLGKHYRFTIDLEGTLMSDKVEYSNSCFAIPAPPQEANVVGAMASHLKTEYPQEHHVFANLVHGVDFYVSTPPSEDIWKIRRGKITKLKN